MRRAPRHDNGVTIVEAAFALPILFLFIFGLVDLGMWTFNSNQAANAARDGARAGILTFELADVDGTADHDAIVAAVRDRLPDNTLDASDIAIECVKRDGTPTTCLNAVVDEDRIHVEVEWNWDLVTPVAALIGVDEGVAKSSATMAIVGRPLATGGSSTTTTTTVPPSTGACAVPTLTVTPSSVPSHANQLQAPVQIDFTTNGSAECSQLRVTLVGSKNNAPTITHTCGCGEGPGHSWTYSGSNNIWASGAYGTVKIMNGSVELASAQFYVTSS